MQSLSLKRSLGWLGVGLGAAQLLAPRTIARLVGLRPGPVGALAIRALGAAELAAGISALRARDGAAEPVIFAVTINRPRDEVYAFFRRLENLPTFMDYLASVEQLTTERSRWTAKLPIAGTVTWEAEIVEDSPGELIEWRTVGDSLVDHRGTVTFTRAPGGATTEIRVAFELGLPGIAPSATLAKLLTRPQVKGDLRRFKQVMETGEVLFSDASAHRGPHPAQPDRAAAEHAAARAAEGRTGSLEAQEVMR